MFAAELLMRPLRPRASTSDSFDAASMRVRSDCFARTSSNLTSHEADHRGRVRTADRRHRNIVRVVQGRLHRGLPSPAPPTWLGGPFRRLFQGGVAPALR